MAKKRLDELLVERGYIKDIEKAKRLVMAGLVFSKQTRLDKAGMKVDEDIPILVKQKSIPYVGRGGLKLEKALNEFKLSVKNKLVIDIGASTGGFTDCALQFGAKMSYAIDVGYNQLDWSLRNDDRVVVMERTNFRYVTRNMLHAGLPNFATIDVSFISLKLILPVLKTLLENDSDIVALIKPQFEARKDQVGKNGIIRDKRIHELVIREITNFAINEGYTLKNLTYSPIKGGEGNIEFLAHFTWRDESNKTEHNNVNILHIVEAAHSHLSDLTNKDDENRE